MELLERTDLNALISRHDAVCISIYMTAHVVGVDTKENPVRLKNLLYRAQRTLGEIDPDIDAHGLLKPAFDLLPDSNFWNHQQGGLTLFISPGFFRWYRLPETLEDRVVVGKAFYLRPLIPIIVDTMEFFVLAISKNGARILKGSRYDIETLEAEGIPKSLEEALRYDDRLQKQLQFYLLEAGGVRRSPQTISHGHGIGAESGKTDIVRYFQKVDRGLGEFLSGREIPLVFAGVDYLFPLYQQANTYPHLLAEHIGGNVDRLHEKNLHQSALELVMPHALEPRTRALARLREVLAKAGPTAQTEIEKIVGDAYYGRIRTLFTAAGAMRWGTFDPANNRVELVEDHHAGGWDLIDFCAVHTYLNRGTVYVLEPEAMPAPGGIAAELRY